MESWKMVFVCVLVTLACLALIMFFGVDKDSPLVIGLAYLLNIICIGVILEKDRSAKCVDTQESRDIEDEYWSEFEENIYEALSSHQLWLAGDMEEKQADFSGLDLSEFDFNRWNCSKVILDNAILDGAIFEKCILNETSFRGAHCHWTNFSRATCKNADFTGANTYRSDFSDTKEVPDYMKERVVGSLEIVHVKMTT